MSKKDKYKIEPEDKCLSATQIFDYIDIKLNATAMHAIEKHMLDCEMCSDAMEGLAKLKNRSKISAFNTSSTSNETEANDSRKIISINHKIKYYSVAAGLVLILVLGFLLNKFESQNENKNSTIVLNTNKNDAQKSTIDQLGKIDTQLAEAEFIPVTSENKNKTIKQIETTESKKIKENKVAYAEPNVAKKTNKTEENSSIASETLNDNDNDYNWERKKENKATPSSMSNTINNPNEKAKEDMKKSNDSIKIDIKKLFPLKLSEKELDLCYENGFKILSKGDTRASLDFFDEVLKYPKHQYYQDAEWQKSIALIQLNRKEEAKMMLQKIITKGGNYKSLAEQELQKIQ